MPRVTWDPRYPDPARVRAEVEGMTSAYVAALLERVPREQVVGLYAKGSAVKPWDAPLDYVPEPYSTATALDAESIRRLDAEALLEHERYLERLPWAVVDMPTKFLWVRLRDLSWRVAPTGARALSALGMPYAEAWGGNRSSIVRRLEALAEHALATAYAAFYASAWDFFLSGYADGDAARRAVLAGAETLGRGARLGRAALAR